MSNGIIQEVFNRQIEYHIAFSKEPHNRLIPAEKVNLIIAGALEKLQQELIEKIKQELDYHSYHEEYQEGVRIGNNILVEKLIGDNQE